MTDPDQIARLGRVGGFGGGPGFVQRRDGRSMGGDGFGQPDLLCIAGGFDGAAAVAHQRAQSGEQSRSGKRDAIRNAAVADADRR